MRTLLLCLLFVQSVWSAPKKVAVFVALCDNATQGIIPVPAKIGDGNKPEANLYWGCSDGFSGCFRASKAWKLQRKEVPEDKRIFERLVYLHESGNIEVTAEAWRGSEIKACLTAFEMALVSGNHDLCAYIGHNVLMDGEVPAPEKKVCQAHRRHRPLLHQRPLFQGPPDKPRCQAGPPDHPAHVSRCVPPA